MVSYTNNYICHNEMIFNIEVENLYELQSWNSYISLHKRVNIEYIKITCDDYLILLYKYHPLDTTITSKFSHNDKYVYIDGNFRVYLHNFISKAIPINSNIKIHVKCNEPCVCNVYLKFKTGISEDSFKHTYIWNSLDKTYYNNVEKIYALVKSSECKNTQSEENLASSPEHLVLNNINYVYRLILNCNHSLNTNELDFDTNDFDNLVVLHIKNIL